MKKYYCIALLATLFFGMASVARADVQEVVFHTGTITFEMGNETYIVKNTTKHNVNGLENAKNGGPAMKVKEGCTATLIIPKETTLELWGSNAKSDKESIAPAYPAIEIPKTSTLIIKGDGFLLVHGGDGLKKTDGKDGKDAYVGDKWALPPYYTGMGAVGGAGSFGNANGIGTPGGVGGLGGVAPQACAMAEDKWNVSRNRASEDRYKGGNGGDGESTKAMGKLYVFGSVSIVCYIGGKSYPYSSNKTVIDKYLSENVSKGGSDLVIEPCNYKSFAGGGGGANGGTCYSVMYGIGAGAPGAGGGGAGGSGGIDDEYWKSNLDFFFGYGGNGGQGDLKNGHDGGRGYKKRTHADGGKGGKAGAAGSRGDNGQLFYTNNVFIELDTLLTPAPKGFYYRQMKAYEKSHSTNLSDLSYDGIVSSHNAVMNHFRVKRNSNYEDLAAFFQGMRLTNYVPDVDVPKLDEVNGNSYFMGYFDQYGNKVFNKDGKLEIALNDDANEANPVIYKNDGYGTWYIDALEDIELHPVWQDSVTVFVNHIVEDAECKDTYHKDCFSSKNCLVITETKRYAVSHGETMRIRSIAYRDLDNNPIEDLNFDDGRYYLAEGEKDTVVTFYDNEPVINIVHKYMRKSYNFKWDYSDLCKSDEFYANLTNAGTYTKAKTLKYGKAITYPELKPIRGKVITGWNPTEIATMPANDLTLKATVDNMLFTVKDSVNRGSTASRLQLSPANALYGQTVTINIELEKGTHLVNLSVKPANDTTKVELKKVNDTSYTFLMPNDHVTLNGEFVMSKYNLLNVQSNMPDKTRVALLDDDDKLYSDYPECFGVNKTDENYGGTIAEYEVYKTKWMKILTNLEGNDTDIENATSATTALRPNVTITSADGELIDETIASRRYFNGRDVKAFEYYVHDASSLSIDIQWESQLAKTIKIEYPLKVKVVSMHSDCQDNIMNSDKRSGVAYANDYVTFVATSQVASFNSDNIYAYYLDAAHRQITVGVEVLKDTVNSNYQCWFRMPERDVTVTISVGTKVAVKTDYPDDLYELDTPDSAVVGSIIPFEILRRTVGQDFEAEPKALHPVGLYGNEMMLAEGTPFEFISVSPDMPAIGACSFVVPDDETFVIKNGIPHRPQIFNDWFTLYIDENASLPDFVEVFSINFNEDCKLELEPTGSTEVMANMPVVCRLDEDKMPESLFVTNGELSSGQFIFIQTDPNSVGQNVPVAINGILVNGTLEDVDCATLEQDCVNGEKIYRFDFDEQLNSPCFRVAETSFMFDAFTVYLKAETQGEPLYPTGIVTLRQGDSTSPSYNIMGMKVTPSYKGIIVKRGKKYIK